MGSSQPTQSCLFTHLQKTGFVWIIVAIDHCCQAALNVLFCPPTIFSRLILSLGIKLGTHLAPTGKVLPLLKHGFKLKPMALTDFFYEMYL